MQSSVVFFFLPFLSLIHKMQQLPSQHHGGGGPLWSSTVAVARHILRPSLFGGGDETHIRHHGSVCCVHHRHRHHATRKPGNTGRWLYGTTGGSRIAKARVNTSGKACTQLHDGYSADEEGKCDGDARLAVSIDMVLSTATVVDQPN